MHRPMRLGRYHARRDDPAFVFLVLLVVDRNGRLTGLSRGQPAATPSTTDDPPCMTRFVACFLATDHTGETP